MCVRVSESECEGGVRMSVGVVCQWEWQGSM